MYRVAQKVNTRVTFSFFKKKSELLSFTTFCLIKESAAAKATNGNGAQNEESTQSSSQQATEMTCHSINPFNKLTVQRPRYPCPDINKMYPFKPNRNTFSGLTPVPGGGLFLFPTIFADMIKRLPPPTCFDGPFVAIDEFLNKFKNLTLPEGFFFLFFIYMFNLF